MLNASPSVLQHSARWAYLSVGGYCARTSGDRTVIARAALDVVVHALVRVRTRLCDCALTFLNLSRGCLRGEDLPQFASAAKVLLARGGARTESTETDVVSETEIFF